jgi:NAD(P)-dependent dehydrogenase (short-subunit alcohol dehydrogenase family)
MPHAIVTGASSGIGEAIVSRLLNQGWNVTGLSRSNVRRDNTHLTAYVSISATARRCVMLTTLPEPHAVIHAAGMMASAPLGELTPEVSQRLWQLHVLAAETLVNHFAPQMASGGRIVVIGSRTSRGAAGRSQYVATKAALVGMVRSWAAELAPRGITANVVAPGRRKRRCSVRPDAKARHPICRPSDG